MKSSVIQIPPNPFDQGKEPKQVMRELLKKSKSLTHQEAQRRMAEAAQEQKRNK